MPGPGLTRHVLRAFIAAVFLAMSPAASAATLYVRADGKAMDAVAIDARVTHLMQAGNVPGLALAVIARSRVAYVKAYGFANVAAHRPLGGATIMYGASLTKAAFATMVMQLVDEGVIALDTPISAYLKKPLPEYEDYRDLADDARWRAITPRMLLSHTAGFPNWRFFGKSGDFDQTRPLRIYQEPGAGYSYSGEGIELLQLVVEEATGKPLAQLMDARIFRRFGMTRTSMVWRDDFAPDYAVNYGATGKALGHNKRSHARAAGSMDTTIADYARFLAAVERGDGLSPASRAEMVRPQIAIHSAQQFPVLRPDVPGANADIALSYGLGWGVFETPFGRAFFKEGHDDGTANYALCLNERGLCIAMLSNSVRAEGIFLYMVDALIGDVRLPWRWEGYLPYDKPASQ